MALWGRAFPDDPPRNEPNSVIDRKLRVQRDLLLVGTLNEVVVGTALAGFDGSRTAGRADGRGWGPSTRLLSRELRATSCGRRSVLDRVSPSSSARLPACPSYRRAGRCRGWAHPPAGLGGVWGAAARASRPYVLSFS